MWLCWSTGERCSFAADHLHPRLSHLVFGQVSGGFALLCRLLLLLVSAILALGHWSTGFAHFAAGLETSVPVWGGRRANRRCGTPRKGSPSGVLIHSEAQSRYFSNRAIVLQNSFRLVFCGYRTITARYVARLGIAQLCLWNKVPMAGIAPRWHRNIARYGTTKVLNHANM